MAEVLNELVLFAGAGGGILAGNLLGWRTVCAVERDAYCAAVLATRQNEGVIHPFPIWSDVETFDGRPWRGTVDIISGGFPCQDISSAGKGLGIDGPKSGLWREFARIIGEVQPRFVWIENSPNIRTRGLVRVLKDLANLGYDARWGVFSAAGSGAPHIRKRMFILAYPTGTRLSEDVPCGNEEEKPVFGSDTAISLPDLWRGTPDLDGLDYGMAYRVDRIRALGNGQVPAVVVRAWETLSKGGT